MKGQRRKLLNDLIAFATASMIVIATQSKTERAFSQSMRKLEADVLRKYKAITKGNQTALLAALLTIYSIAFLGQVALLVSASQAKAIAAGADKLALANQKFMKRQYIDAAYRNNIKAFVNAWKKFRDVATRAQRKDEKLRFDMLKRAAKEFADSVRWRDEFIFDEEMFRTSEKARFEAAMHVSNTGVEIDKQWHTQRDKRVRNNVDASHVKMQGKRVPLKDKFKLVPRGSTLYPKGSGIPEQDIHCRCWLMYKTK